MAFRRSSTAGDAVREADQEGSGNLAHLVVDEITWYMREHKISRAELAQSMNVSAGRVSQVLSGDENLTLRTLAGVISSLGAQVEFSLRAPDDPAGLPDASGHLGEDDDLFDPVRSPGPPD
jgi:transcriptional regulator with XRE-family HTH domain